jgi:Zn finger protein HypA/HybF involved in hydrogenase expression
MHPTDGNTHAIESQLAEQERYEDAQPVILYCRPCDEIISSEDWPSYVYRGTCPDCGGELEETS